MDATFQAHLATTGARMEQRPVMLLAPAGSLKAAVEALQAGADAIYVGLMGWSRGGARNELDHGQLRRCLEMAHSLRKRVELAANVVPKPKERQALLRELAEFAGWGLHGVIVNDAGFLREVRQMLPGLPITASIGCGALNTRDVLFYQDLGATAVVLPGHLDPQEIGDMKAVSSVQVEVMLHMVQEFLQLGKCWMPSYLNFAATGRAQPAQRLGGSVKRGGVGACFRVCQQPWTLLYDGADTGRSVLPSRQLSRIADLAAFLDAGADTVKIQGRSLSPETVGAITRRYRSAIDAWKSGQKFDGHDTALPAMWTVQGR